MGIVGFTKKDPADSPDPRVHQYDPIIYQASHRRRMISAGRFPAAAKKFLLFQNL
jgi:hypothetical protein